MEELYKILEELLSTEDKVQSLRNVFELLGRANPERKNMEVQSLVSVLLDSLDGINSKLHESITLLDLFIADNAMNHRSNESKNSERTTDKK